MGDPPVFTENISIPFIGFIALSSPPPIGCPPSPTSPSHQLMIEPFRPMYIYPVVVSREMPSAPLTFLPPPKIIVFNVALMFSTFVLFIFPCGCGELFPGDIGLP